MAFHQHFHDYSNYVGRLLHLLLVMSYTGKRFEELDVLDDFLMSAIAGIPEIGEAFCRRILSVLLQREIGKIKVTAQHTLPALSPSHRGIRMDVEIEEFKSDADMPAR